MIYFKSNIVNNKDLSDEAIFCYLALKGMDTQAHMVCASPTVLWSFMVWEDIPLSSHLANRILDGLYELKDNELISIEPCGRNHIHLIKTDRLFFDPNCNFFSTIREDEIRSLLKATTESGNKFGLLRYYASVLATFSSTVHLNINGQSKNYVASYAPLKVIAKLSGFSHNTIYKYNKLLKELKILYIANPHLQSRNYYCRYENKDALDAFLSDLSSDEMIDNIPK